MSILVVEYASRIKHLEAENARLTAEVERLTKVVEQVSQSSAQRHIIELTRAAINKEPRT